MDHGGGAYAFGNGICGNFCGGSGLAVGGGAIVGLLAENASMRYLITAKSLVLLKTYCKGYLECVLSNIFWFWFCLS